MGAAGGGGGGLGGSGFFLPVLGRYPPHAGFGRPPRRHSDRYRFPRRDRWSLMIHAESVPLLDCSVNDVLIRFAAKEPAPGGGAAAAFTAAMAAGLLGMVARFSTKQLIDSAGRAAQPDRFRNQVAALA